MWLAIEHRTRFSYDTPISEAFTEIRLKPSHHDGQRCTSFTLQTEPWGVTVDEYADRFGNVVHHFDVLEPHDALVVTARSEVLTSESFVPEEPQPTLVERWDFLQATRYVPLNGPIAELARSVELDDLDPHEEAQALMNAVRQTMTYETGTTHVHTTAVEALSDGNGVCQDFAHVLIGVCRARGIPARYVSGYLHDPSTPPDEVASHAWVDVLHTTQGWLSLDPTHGTEQTAHYVRVGVGRDHADVAPTRGVYKGKAAEQLDVRVAIRLL